MALVNEQQRQQAYTQAYKQTGVELSDLQDLPAAQYRYLWDTVLYKLLQLELTLLQAHGKHTLRSGSSRTDPQDYIR